MLLKQKDTPKINYLENWPSQYYDIADPSVKKEYLEQALAKELDPKYDPYRMKLLEKRYFSGSGGKKTKKAAPDRFMHSWTMIKASASMDYKTFLRKKRAEKELLSYMKDFCLIDYEPESPEEKQVLTDEWADFSARLIESCVSNRTYCSAVFGIIPIGDKIVARKLVSDINLVTRDYPAIFGQAEKFSEFRQLIIDVYCQKIEDGKSYWI